MDRATGRGTDQYVIQLLSRREISLWLIDQMKRHLGWEFDVQYVDTYGNISTECLYTIRAEANAAPNRQVYTADPGGRLLGYEHQSDHQP